MSAASNGLTPKQARFVEEYLIDRNGTQAAIRTGYSPATAAQQASRLLSNAKIAAAVAVKVEKASAKAEATVERVLEELAMLAFYDPADIATVIDEATGEPIRIAGPEQIAKLPVHIRKAIVGWGWDKAGNFTLRFAPKPATLQLIGQHLGMFKQEVEVTVNEGFAGVLEAARRRARSETQASPVH